MNEHAKIPERRASDIEFTVRRNAEAAKTLMAHIRREGADGDEELVADAIEGETGLTEAIEAALGEIDECEALEAGLDAKIDEFSTRRAIIGKRRERVRAAVEQAMVAVDLPSLRLPTATLSVTKRAPQVIVTNEADIPSAFWKQPDPPAPKLDKKALAAALALGPVAGAQLDNGSISLSVRRK